jgi:acetyl esterase/lipase
MIKYFISVLFLFFFGGKAMSQEFIALWPKGKMPNSKGLHITDSISNERIFRVGTPGMYAFFPSLQENKGAAVVICPGGGYERLAYIISGMQLAKWFNAMGVSAFVLNYRLPNGEDLIQRETGLLMDAQRAAKIIRSRAAEWKINPAKIGIQGSSAGGHLAAMAGNAEKDLSMIGDQMDTVGSRYNFTILVSPVIDMGEYAHKGSRKNLLGDNPSSEMINRYSMQLQVNDKTPPCFIAGAFNDKSVHPMNSLLFYKALLEKNISTSFHVFPQGGHAIALRNNPGSTELWTNLCEAWMIEMGFIPQSLTK